MEKFNKKNPFKTPDDYFEEFNGKLLDKIAADSPVIPKEEGFGLPENYFDGLHERIQEKLHGRKPKVIPLQSYKKYVYTAASIAAILLVLVGLNWGSSEEITFEDLASEEIENYFENNDFELTSYEIAEVLPLDELEMNDFFETQLNEENVLDYLDENTENYDELNLEDDE